MTFKVREKEKGGKRNNQSQKANARARIKERHKDWKPLIAGFVFTVPYSALFLLRPRKDLSFQ